MLQFPEGFYFGETAVGELGLGPKRKTGSALGAEVWPGEFSAENYAWPRRKAGGAWRRGGVAQNRSSDLCVTSNFI